MHKAKTFKAMISKDEPMLETKINFNNIKTYPNPVDIIRNYCEIVPSRKGY